jgi:serine/threonine protein kinase
MKHTTETFLRIEAIFNDALAAPEAARAELIEAQANGDAETGSRSVVAARSLRSGRARYGIAATRCRNRPGDGKRTKAHRPLPAGSPAGPRRHGRRLPGASLRWTVRAGRGHQADRSAPGHRSLPGEISPGAADSRRLATSFIARLLDGGVTQEGDPYLVMEYVDGVPIHRFCESRSN